MSETKFNVRYLDELHTRLISHMDILLEHHEIVVEALREIAEMVVYGDNNSEALFDYFCEKNMLSLFLKIMKSENTEGDECPGDVLVQILQTLSILVNCVRNETSLYYLLSNNYINNIIAYPFRFEDDENLCDQFVSFMKCLSLRLNEKTIHFFFMEEMNTFPLLNRAIDLLSQPDPMVRIASQTTILNVYRVNDPRTRDFVLQQGIMHSLFSQIVKFINEKYRTLLEQSLLYSKLEYKKNHHSVNPNASRSDSRTSSQSVASDDTETPKDTPLSQQALETEMNNAKNKVIDTLSSAEDWFYYIQDLFDLNIFHLNYSLVSYLIEEWLRPDVLSKFLFLPTQTTSNDNATSSDNNKNNTSTSTTTDDNDEKNDEMMLNFVRKVRTMDLKPDMYFDSILSSTAMANTEDVTLFESMHKYNVTLLWLIIVMRLLNNRLMQRATMIVLLHPSSYKHRADYLEAINKDSDDATLSLSKVHALNGVYGVDYENEKMTVEECNPYRRTLMFFFEVLSPQYLPSHTTNGRHSPGVNTSNVPRISPTLDRTYYYSSLLMNGLMENSIKVARERVSTTTCNHNPNEDLAYYLYDGVKAYLHYETRLMESLLVSFSDPLPLVLPKTSATNMKNSSTDGIIGGTETTNVVIIDGDKNQDNGENDTPLAEESPGTTEDLSPEEERERERELALEHKRKMLNARHIPSFHLIYQNKQNLDNLLCYKSPEASHQNYRSHPDILSAEVLLQIANKVTGGSTDIDDTSKSGNIDTTWDTRYVMDALLNTLSCIDQVSLTSVQAAVQAVYGNARMILKAYAEMENIVEDYYKYIQDEHIAKTKTEKQAREREASIEKERKSIELVLSPAVLVVDRASLEGRSEDEGELGGEMKVDGAVSEPVTPALDNKPGLNNTTPVPFGDQEGLFYQGSEMQYDESQSCLIRHLSEHLVALKQKAISDMNKVINKVLVGYRAAARRILAYLNDTETDSNNNDSKSSKDNDGGGELDMLVVSLYLEELNRLKERRWSAIQNKIPLTPELFLPQSEAVCHSLGLDFAVPIAMKEGIRREVQVFIALRALLKKLQSFRAFLIANAVPAHPTLSTDGDDTGDNGDENDRSCDGIQIKMKHPPASIDDIYKEVLSDSDELYVLSEEHIFGNAPSVNEWFPMKGRKFLEAKSSAYIDTNDDTSSTRSSERSRNSYNNSNAISTPGGGVFMFGNSSNTSTPDSALSAKSAFSISQLFGFKRPSIGSTTPKSQNTSPQDLYSQNSRKQSLPGRMASRMLGSLGISSIVYKTMNILFVQSDNLLLIVESTPKSVANDAYAIVIASPLIYTESMIDDGEPKKMKIIVRSWSRMSNMERIGLSPDDIDNLLLSKDNNSFKENVVESETMDIRGSQEHMLPGERESDYIQDKGLEYDFLQNYSSDSVCPVLLNTRQSPLLYQITLAFNSEKVCRLAHEHLKSKMNVALKEKRSALLSVLKSE